MTRNIVGFLNLFDSPNLGQLTQKRTLGSTSFLCRFALMDFSLSNFTNSGIDNINILVKDNFRSVSKHVGSFKAWVNNTKKGRQNILINEDGIRNPKKNTDINCLMHNDWVLYESKADIAVITPAHIITRMDLRPIIAEHISNDADVTVVYQNIDNADVAFGSSNVLKIQENKVISSKRNTQKAKKACVSLETYIIGKNTLNIIGHDDEYLKLGSIKKIIEKLVNEKSARVFAYEYTGYARCFDSCKHFVDYSFELLDFNVSKQLFGYVDDKEWPIYTLSHNTKPALYGEHAKIKNSYIANGAKIDGTVENSIISRDVIIAKGAVVKNSIIFTGSEIDAGAKITYSVIDKYAHISAKATVEGKQTSPTYIEQGQLVK